MALKTTITPEEWAGLPVHFQLEYLPADGGKRYELQIEAGAAKLEQDAMADKIAKKMADELKAKDAADRQAADLAKLSPIERLKHFHAQADKSAKNQAGDYSESPEDRLKKYHHERGGK